ncbi:hypothetical protein L6475_01365 [Prevotella sp. E9-3]|uniref:hypothetical protein n=1 Tax=Prevotella sp. E9-3 TaxID=2913621 RepID=UPI001EDBA416|nr:hypothetical protein [Prevotella sp. E9-3]UKK48642.1 hypothetical protein L6475_01365 [Prevotella sp. E9-3]
MNTQLKYVGSWQHGSTVLQKLDGPIGDGAVYYPNGDRFKGYFHLSYARINGPAHAAKGRYDFADGSYIEQAWIHTSKEMNPDFWGLHGVFRIHHPDGPDSIALFCHGGQRYGFELFLDEKNPRIKEWYAGKEVVRGDSGESGKDQLALVDFQIDETGGTNCMTLKLTVKLGNDLYRVEQIGGRYTLNKYDNNIYEPYTHVVLCLPNGDSLEYYGDDVRNFQPYDGYVTVHNAQTGMYRTEQWEKGKLVDDQQWRRDYNASVSVMLPDPTGAEGQLQANVWKDNYIEYSQGEWVYTGEVKDNRPEGNGLLVGDYSHGNRRYEGDFREGVFVNKDVCTEKITLHVKSSENGRYKEYDMEAKLGKLGIQGFWNYEITSVKSDCIIIEFYEEKYEVRPDKPLHLYKEIEGREWSDGCVYDSDDYTLDLTWIR